MLGIHPEIDITLERAVGHINGTLNKTAFMGDRMITFDKSAAFLEDTRFAKALDRCAKNDEERSRVWRIHTLLWAAQNALSLDGDFVECGVFEGFMSAMVADYLEFANLEKTFYLYDTFEGFSEKYSSPNDFPGQESFYDFANKVYGEPGIFEAVKQRFATYPNVKVIKGVVPDVLHEDAPEKISYLHINLNSPKAERGALGVLFDRVQPGAIIIFDDCGWSSFRSQMNSADTFMLEKGLPPILELPTGQGLAMKR